MAYSSKLANYLLYTPFDNKANVEDNVSSNLTPEKFITKCYKEPDFRNINIFKNSNDKFIDNDDYTIKSSEIINKQIAYKNDETNFLNWLQDRNNSKVYTISGNAGTGKTTYINKLKYDKTYGQWIILDISTANPKISWINDVEMKISSYYEPCQKIYSVVLSNIKSLLLIYDNENGKIDITLTISKIREIVSNYQNKISSYYQKGKIFFNKLNNILRSHSNNDDCIKECINYIVEYFTEIENNSKNNLMEIFCSSLDIFLNILRCYNSDSFESNFIIVFDNLERFISYDELQNKELDIIRKELISYSNNLYSYGNCHNGHFKFIMVLRNNSIRMCGVKVQSADELPSNLDLSDWYNIDKIIKAKEQWYMENKIQDIGKNIEIMKQIVGDLRTCEDSTLTGLSLQINPLFNNNKRLIIDFIGKSLEQVDTRKQLLIYEKYWRKDTPISRFAARSIVRGLVIKELASKDQLFYHLWLYTKDKKKNNNNKKIGLGDTRKILTLLYNSEDESVPLNQVLSQLYSVKDIEEHWENKISKIKKERIAQLLYYMNSYNRRENDWIQFIDIQLYNPHKNIVIENPKELLSLINNEMDNISLTIMPAGEAYLKYVVASFEYFSFRYCEKPEEYIPLFAVIPSPEEIVKIKNIKELECYKILSRTSKKALECIVKIKKDIPLRLYQNFEKKKHKIRIIELHKGYIDKFIEFINDYYINRSKQSSDVVKKYEELIQECITIKNLYN